MAMAAPSPRAPPVKRSAPSAGMVDSIMSDAAAEMSIADPGVGMGTLKRFDHRMSPAHARLRGLAAELPRPAIASPSKLDGNSLLAEQPIAPMDGDDFRGRGLGASGVPTEMLPPQPPEDLSWQSAIATMHHRASTGEMKMHAVPRKAPIGGKWSKEEDDKLKEIVQENGPKNWKRVAELLGTTRTDVQCLHRWNKVLKPGLLKGPWTAEEDEVVTKMVLEHGVGNIKWSVIAGELPGRIGKQCRERWFNHLDPSIKRGEWTMQEDKILFEAQRVCGNRWCEIAKLLPGRTENAVKNRFNSSARKRWLKDNGLEDRNEEALMLNHNRSEIARLVREILDVNDTRHKATEEESGISGKGMQAPLDKGSPLHVNGTSTVIPPGQLPLRDAGAHDNDGSPSSTLQDLPASFKPPSLSLGGNEAGGGSTREQDLMLMTPTSGFLSMYEDEKRRSTTAEANAMQFPSARSTAQPQKLGASCDSGITGSGLDGLAVPKVDWAKPSPRARSQLHADVQQSAKQEFEAASQAWAVAKAVRHVKDVYSSQPKEMRSTMAVPLEMVPFFGFLTEAGKRSIMRQLVAKFRHDYHANAGRVPPVPGSGTNVGGVRREGLGSSGPMFWPPQGPSDMKAPTPLHAAAAAVEPVNVYGASELDNLFDGDNFPMDEQELKHLWTISPRGNGASATPSGTSLGYEDGAAPIGSVSMSPRANAKHERFKPGPTRFPLNGSAVSSSPFNRQQKAPSAYPGTLPSAAAAAAAGVAQHMRSGSVGSERESASQASLASITSDDIGALIGSDPGFGLASGSDTFNFELKDEDMQQWANGDFTGSM